MTRKDAIKRLKLWLICSEEYTEDDVSMNEAITIAINSLEIDERYELEYEDAKPKTDVLDKIRAEIKRLHYHPKLDFIENDAVIDIALEIIDKYKAESEDKE